MNLSALIARVEEGTGPDRELDALVLCAVIAPAGSKVEQSRINGAWCIYSPKTWGPEGWRLWETPLPWRADHASLTASLDAVLSLIEKKLPGWFGDVDVGVPTPLADGLFGARLFRPDEKNGANIAGEAKSPARALLAATLRALSALEDSKADLADATNGDRS